MKNRREFVQTAFDNREAVIPQVKAGVVRDGIAVFPAASVTALSICLA